MSTLMISVSGIRGIIGQSLTPEIITNFALAFGTINKGGAIVIARDTRASGLMVSLLLKGALLATGCSVIDIDVATTPTIEVMISALKASGGVMVSASHNPIQWNAFKFFNKHGELMTFNENAQLLKIYNEKLWGLAPWSKINNYKEDSSANEKHIELVLKNINYKRIKHKRLTVALDSINGAGGEITLAFLKELHCKVFSINTDMSGNFAHKPEPILKNLKPFIRYVSSKKVDASFIQDPDADRLVILDENGSWLGEEYTASICIKEILKIHKSPVVVNMSSSRMNEDIAKEFGVDFFRSKVGEANVIELMKKKNSLAGGEGNGGIIAGHIHYGRDSLVGIGLILQAISNGQKVSELAHSIPAYFMLKDSFSIENINLNAAINKIKNEFKNETITLDDGIRIDFNQKWVHLRSSNTEPIVRVISEAKTKKEAKQLITAIRSNFF